MRKLARGLTLIICILFVRQAIYAQSTAFAVDASPKRYISIPTPSGSSLRLFDDWTLEALVYVPVGSGTNEIHIIESYGALIMNGGYILRLTNKKVKAYSVGPTGYHQAVGNTQVNEGEWNHVAATFNESTGKLTVYLNGKEDGSSIASSPLQTYNNPNLYIGARGDDQNINHDVELEEIRIWNDIRTENEIFDNMNKCLTGTEQGLVGYYDFEGVTTSTIQDKTSNGNDGTMQNYTSSAMVTSPLDCSAPDCAANGLEFIPDGELRALVVYVTFIDNPSSNPSFVNANQPLNRWNNNPNGLPDYVDGTTGDFDLFMYNDVSDFTTYTTADEEYRSLSNFYYQMSKPEKDFKLIGEVFTNSAGVPTSVEIDPSGNPSAGVSGWIEYNRRALTAMADSNSNFDFSSFDQRLNGSGYDPVPVIQIGDEQVDFVVFIYRYSGDMQVWAWPQQPFPGIQNWGGSGGGFSGTGLNNHYDNDVDNPRINAGFTMPAGGLGGGLPIGTFIHELAHANYSFPHIGSVNGVVGQYFYGQEAYGSTSNGLFNSMNAYERWKMQYIDLQKGSIDRDITPSQNPSPIVLGDYLTDGEALRIEIPFSGGQHLWIENHQKEDPIFDEHLFAGNTSIDPTEHPGGIPGAEKGIYMYVEHYQHSSGTSEQCAPINFHTSANAMKMIFRGGQYDYTYPATPSGTNGWSHNLYDVERGAENPIGGTSPYTRPRVDRDLSGVIGVNTNSNSPTNNEDLSRLGIREKVTGSTTMNLYRGFNAYDTRPQALAYSPHMSFQPGDVLNMGTNPTIINYPTYDLTNARLNPVFLNGLEVIMADAGGGNYSVTVNYEQVDISNNVRWTGNDIRLPDIRSGAAEDLILKTGNTIWLDKNGVNNRHTLHSVGNDFINPTVFTVDDNATMKLESNSIVHIRDNSTFVLSATGKLILEDGAQLIIDEDAIFHLEGNDIVLNGPDARIVVHGTLASDAGIDFTFDGPGYVQFHPTNQLDLGVGARFYIHGPAQGHRMMELVENTTVDVDGNTMTLYTGKVIYQENTKLKAHNNQVFVNYVDFEGPGKYSNTYALEVYDNTLPFFFFRYNNLYDLGVGLYCSNPTGNNSYTNIIENSFDNMGLGIYNSDLNSLTTSQNSFDGVDYGVYIVDNAGSYASNDDEFANGWNAVYVEDADFVALNGTVISTFNDGVYAENTTIYMRQQATISDCNNGINSVNASTPTPADDIIIGDHSCAYIINNSTGIKGNDIILQVDATTHAANRGSLFVTPNRFDGNNLIFDVCYHNSSSITSINARENDYGTAFTPVLYNLDRKNTSGTCYHHIPLIHSHLDADASNCEEPPLSIVEPVVEDESAEGEIGLGLEAINADRVKLYPNPTTGIIQLDLRQTVSNVTVKITNALGQEVSVAHYEQLQQAALELQGPAGLYFVHLIIEDQEQATLKVVKK